MSSTLSLFHGHKYLDDDWLNTWALTDSLATIVIDSGMSILRLAVRDRSTIINSLHSTYIDDSCHSSTVCEPFSFISEHVEAPYKPQERLIAEAQKSQDRLVALAATRRP